MYDINQFFDKLLKICLKLFGIILLLMGLYVSVNMVLKTQGEPVTMKVLVTDKFEEDRGYVLFDNNIKTSEKQKMIRVEFFEQNKLTTNVFPVHKTDYDKIQTGFTYEVKFKTNGELGYIDVKTGLPYNSQPKTQQLEENTPTVPGQ